MTIRHADRSGSMLGSGFLPRLPGGIWTLSGFTTFWFLGVVLPLIGIVIFSFLQTKGVKIQWDWSFTAYQKLFFYGGGNLLERTIRIAATMTVIELLLAFPFALWLAKGAKKQHLETDHLHGAHRAVFPQPGGAGDRLAIRDEHPRPGEYGATRYWHCQ